MGDLSFILGAGQNRRGGTEIKRAGHGRDRVGSFHSPWWRILEGADRILVPL